MRGSLVLRTTSLLPSQPKSVPIYTPGSRWASKSKVPCSRTQHSTNMGFELMIMCYHLSIFIVMHSISVLWLFLFLCTCFYVLCMDWEKMWVERMGVWYCFVLSYLVFVCLFLVLCFVVVDVSWVRHVRCEGVRLCVWWVFCLFCLFVCFLNTLCYNSSFTIVFIILFWCLYEVMYCEMNTIKWMKWKIWWIGHFCTHVFLPPPDPSTGQ